MIIEFEPQKDVKAHRDNLQEKIENFVQTLPEIKLEREFIYVKTLSALFNSMRESLFSDEEIDNVICRAAACEKSPFYAVNSNRQPSWYTE